MFDVGFSELVLIGIVAMLVFGPERLPGLARQVGSWIGATKRFVNSVRADIEHELGSEELKRMLNEQQSEISKLKGMISDTHAQVNAELQEAERSIKSVGHGSATNAGQTSSRHQDTTARETHETAHPEGTKLEHGAKRFRGS
ncbi:MAG: Sec-independent protein translocase protein TatB [Pseudomonadota bacterium]|jgi:sec-independent protein translocase protein TatB|nr:Sec-independent protein translocase protein TatB [Pseudomonadota bacterium]